MDICKYQLGTLCLLLLPLSVAGQEWSKQDSLRLQQLLKSDQEININRKFVEKTEQNMLYHTKSFVDFDPTLPALKSPIMSPKLSLYTHHVSDALILSSCPLILGLKYTRILLCTVKVTLEKIRTIFMLKFRWIIASLKNGLSAYMVNKIWMPEDIGDFHLK